MSPEVESLVAAAARAPDAAGGYVFLGAGTELLYVGKAGSLRRRLQQHARARPGAGGARLDLLYRRVREVRWVELPDEAAAAVWEADLIAGLHPVFNAGSASAGCWNYLLVQPVGGDVHRLTLARSPDLGTGGGRAYGCFPHLGRGVGSPPGTACSDGYPAMLRLLWAAPGPRRDHPPARITRSAPELVTLPVPQPLLRPLHAFLSGTSSRLLGVLATRSRHPDPPIQQALDRDRQAATEFFDHGPHRLRQLRLRHGRPSGPVSRAEIEQMLTADVRAAIGEFRLPADPDPADAILGRKARPWARS